MALNRPRVDPKSGAKTSVVLGYYKGPHITTYHGTFELNMPKKSLNRQPRFQLPPSEIFHRTEPKCPLTVHQASFGDTPKGVTNRVYQERKRELKAITDIHLLKSVPIGRNSYADRGTNVSDTSQMRTDYVDRHHLLHSWTVVQHPQLPQLAPTKETHPKEGHLRWYGHKTEAAHQFQWPVRDGRNMNLVKFRRN